MASRLIPLIATLALVLGSTGCGGDHAVADARPAGSTGGPTIGNMSGTKVRLWAVGDAVEGSHAGEVARLIARGKPNRLLYLGDVYPDGSRSAYRDYTRVFGPLNKLTAPTPGNHEWPKRSEGYLPYWHHPPEWYSFKAAGWRIIELNSETSRDEAQLTWLGSQLRANGDCRIAFWHRPRFSAGPHGDATDMDPYWQALRSHARMVISGHDHGMQRFDPDGTLMQLVSGAGGHSHYGINRGRPGLVFANNTAWGGLRIDLSPGTARIAFVSTAGRVLDSQRVNCRP
jgi:hypothetical protein